MNDMLLDQNLCNVQAFGARSEPGYDNYPAFAQALQSGRAVYVPAGCYEISRGLRMEDTHLFGDGLNRTRIICRDVKESAVCIRAGRSCTIEQLSIEFAPELLTGQEGFGQRVGLLTGNERSLQRGSSIRNVRIMNVGTGICSMGENATESFSVTYDTLEICDFTYRGVDFRALNRTGNVFSNIYMYSRYEVDTLFSLETEESEVAIHQLNIEHTRCRCGVRLVGVRAFSVSTMHFEGLFLTKPNSAFLHIANSAGSIGALTAYYSTILAERCALIRLGGTVYDIGHDWAPKGLENLDFLRIGTLHLKGLNDPNYAIAQMRLSGLNEEKSADFRFFLREKDAPGVYRVQLDSYAYYTFKDDGRVYEAIPAEGEIDFIRKGYVQSHGPTAQRPTARLCPWRTQYFDTDVGRMLLWNGESWIVQ